ncbi:unnamed protein product [Penicillium bialowiezense]
MIRSAVTERSPAQIAEPPILHVERLPPTSMTSQKVGRQLQRELSHFPVSKVNSTHAYMKPSESKIASLEQRLSSLEAETTGPTLQSPGIHNHTEERLDTTSNENHPQISVETSRPFEGGSSFAANAVHASEAVEMNVDNVSEGGSGLKDTLSHLNTALQPLDMEENYSFRASLSRLLPNISWLPTALVIGILQRFKERRPIFLSSYAVNDLGLVEQLCQDIYFPMSPISIGQVTSMHGILYFLLKEYQALKDPLCQKFDFDFHLAQCEKNFIIGLETYDIMAKPSFENILGLTMGAIKAQGEAKPFLCSSLISTAATHCQTLGFHRAMTYTHIHPELSRHYQRLFWAVYVFDKNVSLLLGKASQLRDSEIDTEYPPLPRACSLRPWDESFLCGIRLASLQGRIYDELYSAEAASKSSSQRALTIGQLQESLEKWLDELKNIDSAGVNNEQVFALTRGNWDIMYYSTLTTLHCATSLPATEINAACFQAARLSLEAHLRLFPKYQEAKLLSDSDYINCVLLFSSFTPFVVQFLRAVTYKNREDLQLLEDVVRTLEGPREASKSYKRLFKICSMFLHLATDLHQMPGPSIGKYNVNERSLQLAHGVHQSHFQWSLFGGAVDVDITDEPSALMASGVLDGWVNGRPLMNSIFNDNTMWNLENSILQ